MSKRPWKNILLLPMCGFGDAVCYLPFLKAVREGFPEAAIVCVVISEPARAVLEAAGANVTVIVFNRGGQQSGWRPLLQFLRRIRGFHFDVAVSGAHPDSPRVPLLAAFSVAALRIGARAERLSFLYNRRLDIATGGHAYDRFGSLLTGLGIDLPAAQYRPVMQPSPQARSGAMELWADAGLNDSTPVIGLVSGADTNARGRWKPYLKRWRPERYAELARWITEETGARPVIFGGKEELPLAEQIAEMAGVPIINFCGRTGVSELPWLLQMCQVLVINDTGLMHLAAAVGTPVVALFGPTSPLAFAPKGEQHFVVQGQIHCSPCYPHPTCDLQGCGAMDDIATEQVKHALGKLLSAVAGQTSNR